MNYFGILKRAYEITFKHKYLWIFGILAGGGVGAGWNISIPSNSGSSEELKNYFSGYSATSFEQFLSNYWGVLIAIVGLILLLGVLWMVFSIISQAALLGSVRAIDNNESNDFRLGFAFGWHKFWRTFAVGLLIGLFFIFSLVILVLPVILFIMAKVYILAIIYGIILFLVDLVFWIYLGVMSPYIYRIAILGEKGSWEAIVSSWDFFTKHWTNIVVIYLILVGIGIGFGIAVIFVMLLVGGLLFAIGYGIFLASSFFFWIYALVFGLAFIILMLVLGGIFTSFNYSVLTLAYLEFTKHP